jgi:hypothetical protein
VCASQLTDCHKSGTTNSFTGGHPSLVKDKSKVVPMLNQAPRHKEVLGVGV